MTKTTLANLVDTKVIADIITSGVPTALRFADLARVFDDLEGRPGSTLEFPAYNYIGKAEDIEDGGSVPLKKLTASSREAKVKQAGIGVEIEDKAVLSAVGDPLGEAVDQIVGAIAEKVDDDLLEAAKGATQTAPSVNSVESLQVAKDVCEDEEDGDYAIILHPNDATALRLDAGKNYLQGSELGAGVITTGVHGEVLGVKVIRSRKVNEGEFYLIKAGALALVSKRETEVESDRDIVAKSTVITADKHYVAYLYNPAYVVKADGGE